MKMRTQLLSIAAVLAMMATLLAVPGVSATTPQDDTTEDILYMADGRILHGDIISEDASSIVFEYRHEQFGAIKMTLNLDDVSKVDRDVARAALTNEANPAANAPAEQMNAPGAAPVASPAYVEDLKRIYGGQLAGEAAEAASVYLIPMRGQMGTDVHLDFYKSLEEDIRRQDPDLIVFQLECTEEHGFLAANEELLMLLGDLEVEIGIFDLEQYRDMVNFFRDELGDIPQVMWVVDSIGVSSVIALAWQDCYLHPDAQLDGLWKAFAAGAGFDDADVRAKMIAAWVANAKAFLEYGGYSMALADAMIDPTKRLSASWHGREVIWSNSGNGQFLVDGSENGTPRFNAKDAEDLLISKGTAETLDDLMLLHGFREYRILPGLAEREFEDYVDSWRASYKTATESMDDYLTFMGRTNGDDGLANMSRARSSMQRVQAAIRRYDAVRVRLEQEGLSEFVATVLIEQLTERIRIARDRDRGDGGGRAGGGGRGAGTPGGPGGL